MTHNFKLNQANQQNTLLQGQAYGPYFGASPDFYIPNKANQNQCSGYIGGTFVNGSYPRNNNTYNLFSGNIAGTFKLKEWEVYKI